MKTVDAIRSDVTEKIIIITYRSYNKQGTIYFHLFKIICQILHDDFLTKFYSYAISM